MRYIAEPNHAEIFGDYVKLRMPREGRRFLLHGSQYFNQQLTPSRKEKFVYATDDPNYAIFLGIINLKNARAAVRIAGTKTKLTVDIDFVNGPSSLRPGWVHVVTGQDFKKTSNHEYVSNKPTGILFAIPVVPADLTIPITLIPST